MPVPLPQQASIDMANTQRLPMQHDHGRTSAAGSSRQMNPQITLATRLILDMEGRPSHARSMLNDIKKALPIYDIDDLREIPTHCNKCRRGLSVFGFMNNQSRLLCIGCKSQEKPKEKHQVVRLIGQDIELLEQYLSDDTPMQLPDLSQTLPRCDQVPKGMCTDHTMNAASLETLLASLGNSHLRHGARNVGLDPDKFTDKKLVPLIMDKLRSAQYFTTNLVVDTQCKGFQANQYSSYMKAWRTHENTWQRCFGMTSNMTSTTMLIIGVAGTWTDWHVDYTEAHNYGMFLDGVVVDPKASKLLPDFLRQYHPEKPETLAVWFFVSPDGMPHAEAWLKLQRDNGSDCSKKSFSEVAEWPMSLYELEAMDTYLKGRGHRIIKVEQCPGDKVYVPPGWGHMVINIKACVKVAWDLYDEGHWPQYLLASHRLHSKVTQERNASDYMEVESALLAQIKAGDYHQRKGHAAPHAPTPLMVTPPVEIERQPVRRRSSLLQSHRSNPEQYHEGQHTQVSQQPVEANPQSHVDLVMNMRPGSPHALPLVMSPAMQMEALRILDMTPEETAALTQEQRDLVRLWNYVQQHYTLPAQVHPAQQAAADQLPTGAHEAHPAVHDAQGIHSQSSSELVDAADDMPMHDAGTLSSKARKRASGPKQKGSHMRAAKEKTNGKAPKQSVDTKKRTLRSTSAPDALLPGLIAVPADVKSALHQMARESHGASKQQTKTAAQETANVSSVSEQAAMEPGQVNMAAVQATQQQPQQAGQAAGQLQLSHEGQLPMHVVTAPQDVGNHSTTVVETAADVRHTMTEPPPLYTEQASGVVSQQLGVSPSVTESPPHFTEQAAVGAAQVEVSPAQTNQDVVPHDAMAVKSLTVDTSHQGGAAPEEPWEEWSPRYVVTAQVPASGTQQQPGAHINLTCAEMAQGHIPAETRDPNGMSQGAHMDLTHGELAQSHLTAPTRQSAADASQQLQSSMNMTRAEMTQNHIPAPIRQSSADASQQLQSPMNMARAEMAQTHIPAPTRQSAAGASQQLHNPMNMTRAEMTQNHIPTDPRHANGTFQQLRSPLNMTFAPFDTSGQVMGTTQQPAMVPFPAHAYWAPHTRQQVLIPIMNLMHPSPFLRMPPTASLSETLAHLQQSYAQPPLTANVPMGAHYENPAPQSVAMDKRKRKRDDVRSPPALSEAQMLKLKARKLVNQAAAHSWIHVHPAMFNSLAANMHPQYPATAPASPMDQNVVMEHT